MKTVHTGRVFIPKSRYWRAASCSLMLALAHLAVPDAVSSQAASSQTPAGQAPQERVRVPTSHANVHMTAGSGAEILVLVSKGTILPVVGRRGEWIQVQLSPELRKTGIVMRWYKNEDRGWMHDSTVEVIKPGLK